MLRLKMKQYVFLLIILAISGAYAYPDLQGQRVSDFAHLMTSEEIQNLTIQIYSMENITGAQFAVVTVNNTEGDNRVDYAARIGDQNGVGIKGLDNGVVILWSMENEPGGAIATGRGVGDILNDAKVARIGRAHRPEFDNGQYYDAFSGILSDLLKEFPNNSTGTPANKGDPMPVSLQILLIVLVVMFVLIVAAAASDSGGGGGSGGFSGGYVASSGGWSSGGGGFSSGGFGGGGFGGGGSGF